LKGLDCPNCAAKIEKGIGKLKGVSSSAINLIKQTATVNIDAENTEAVEEQIRAIIYSYEPEVEVFEIHSQHPVHNISDSNPKKTILRMLCGALIFTIGIIFKTHPVIYLAFLIISYIILGYDVLFKAIKNIIKGKVFDENFLMSISTIGAFAIGEYPEAVAVMLFYQIGEFFGNLSVNRSRKSIADLMNIRPDFTNVIRNGEITTVSPESVAIDEIIIVKPGEKIALDGIIIDGTSSLDTKALTGESVPKTVKEGDVALSGCINLSGVLSIKVTKAFGESTAAKIIDLIENASSKKAPTENFITTFARYYTPVVVILALLLAIIGPAITGGTWSEWLHKSLVFLVISCPCALVLSIPLTFFGGIGTASKHGILIKGANFLEALNSLSYVVFDKTGTLTKGVFKVTEVVSANGFSKEQVLEFAAKAEILSNHPIAKSILLHYNNNIDQREITDYKELSGYGISAFVANKKVFAGNDKLLESENITYTPCEKVGTKVYIAVDSIYAGCIIISDELKQDSKKAVSNLKRMGVEKTIMLTGDNKIIAEHIAKKLQLDEYYAELLPDQKVEKIELLESKKRSGRKLAFVGDGINDAPVLSLAQIGIAMGGLGSDAAIEAADIVLMTDEPSKLIEAIKIAKATKRIVIQNIIIALSIKLLFLLLGALGIATMWEAVFGDVGVTLIAVFNAMRIMKK